MGQRPGEALGCLRAKEGAGCGTTEYCTVCGAGQTLLSIAQGRDDERACRMLAAPPAKDLDLTVKATRLHHGGTTFTVLSASDRSEQNRRRALEKLFFHDVLNTAGAANPTEPDWSPDGKWIAFTRQAGAFDICGIPADGSLPPTVLVAGQNPSWAPNSRTLVFDHAVGHRQVLSVLDVFTKQYKDCPRTAGNNSQPAWAK
jgi:hypothetical protein